MTTRTGVGEAVHVVADTCAIGILAIPLVFLAGVLTATAAGIVMGIDLTLLAAAVWLGKRHDQKRRDADTGSGPSDD